jgi:hypothetical protein
MRWFFGMSGRDVHLQARAEGPGGTPGMVSTK